MHAIVSGGFNDFHSGSQDVFSLHFEKLKENTVDEYICNPKEDMPPMNVGRFCHGSTIVKIDKDWFLFVVGGKSSPKEWLSSTEMLNLKGFFYTGFLVKNKEGETVELK